MAFDAAKRETCTVEQMAHVSVKNHRNAVHNPYAQKRRPCTVEEVRAAPMVAWPLSYNFV